MDMKRVILKTGIFILLGVMINYYCDIRVPVPAITNGKLQLLLDGCVTAIILWVGAKIIYKMYDEMYRVKLKRDERYILSGNRLQELEINTADEYLKYLWTMLYERPLYIHLPFFHLMINVPKRHVDFGSKQYHEVGIKLFLRFFDELSENGLPEFDWGKINKKLTGYNFLEYAVAARCIKQEHPGLSLDMVAIYPIEQALKRFPEYASEYASFQSEGSEKDDIRLMAFVYNENNLPEHIYYIENDSYWKKVENSLHIFK